MKTVIITGASQGIGAELFRQFSLKKDICIYALSRNVKQLNKLSLGLQSSTNITSLFSRSSKQKETLSNECSWLGTPLGLPR